MNRHLNTVAAAAMTVAVIAGYARATDYRYTTIDYPGALHSYPSGINDSGQIVGDYSYASEVYHGFLLSGGAYTSFDHPNASLAGWGTVAGDINSFGQIVGTYSFRTPQGHRNRGYLRTGDDYIDLVFPGTPPPGNVVYGMNDLGQAVGIYYNPYPSYSAFFFDGASYTPIEYPGETYTALEGINNHGSMVGYYGNPDIVIPRGFLLENGTFTPLDVPGFPAALGTGINERGDIAGVTGESYETRRTFVLSGGSYSILHVPGALATVGLDINNLGHVIGQYRDTHGIWHGYLATPITDPVCDFNSDAACDIFDLNPLLAAGPVAPGVAVTPGVTEQFDLNGDALINNADVDAWLWGAAAFNGFVSPYQRGDANLDGVVDGSDFGLWNAGKFSSTLLWNGGDFNGDGVADGSDFGIWNAHKFTSSDIAPAVPEPVAFALVFLGAVLWGIRNRYRQI